MTNEITTYVVRDFNIFTPEAAVGQLASSGYEPQITNGVVHFGLELEPARQNVQGIKFVPAQERIGELISGLQEICNGHLGRLLTKDLAGPYDHDISPYGRSRALMTRKNRISDLADEARRYLEEIRTISGITEIEGLQNAETLARHIRYDTDESNVSSVVERLPYSPGRVI